MMYRQKNRSNKIYKKALLSHISKEADRMERLTFKYWLISTHVGEISLEEQSLDSVPISVPAA